MIKDFYIRGYVKCDAEGFIGQKVYGNFTWCMSLLELSKKIKSLKCPCCNRKFIKTDRLIEDHHGSLYTLKEFLEEVRNCEDEIFSNIKG